jgi:hypothetical protein
MNALIALGGVVVGGTAGLFVGTALGDRQGHYMDFGFPALVGGLTGAAIGAGVGAVVAVGLFAS